MEVQQRRKPEMTSPLEMLPGEVAGRYRIHVDAADVRGEPRYTAVARSLQVRPYAVVTRDPSELMKALGRSSLLDPDRYGRPGQ
jgi:hypothetical protein